MCVKIPTFGLILSYVVIIFYSSTVKLQLISYNSTLSVPVNQSQCSRVNETIKQGKVVPECYCDTKCSEYRDCCPKSTFRGNASKPFQNCTSFANGDFYVKRYCPTETGRKKCATNYTFVNIKNLKNKIPVTSLKTGLSFGNKNCAACHNVSDFQLWNVNVTCDDYSNLLTVFDNSSRPSFTRNGTGDFKYNKKLKSWQITMANVTKNCTLRPAVPDNLKPLVRPCIPNMIRQCTTLTFAQLLCSQYQSIYVDTNSSKIYRNKMCAWCSGAITNISLLRDIESAGSKLFQGSSPMSTVATSTPGPTIITSATPATTGRFPRFNPSRRFPPMRSRRTTFKPTTTSRPAAPQYKVIGRSYLYVSIRDGNYSETLSRINMTKILTETRTYTSISRTYVRNVTKIQGSAIRTCNISEIAEAEAVQIPRIVPIVFNIVLLLGNVFLGLSILHFVTPQSSTNYQYRCIMTSYTVAIFISNVGWFFQNIVDNSAEDLFVPFDHVVSYFAFLTSMMSTTTMAFHVSCTSWKAFYQFSTIKNNSLSKNLFLYSMVIWFLPAILTMSQNSAFASPTSNLNGNLHLIFFILPFVVVCSVNLSFYINSAILIVTQKVVEENLQKLEINFKFFSALLWITHLMWLVALLFCYIRSYLLIVSFYMLNLIVCLLVYCIASGSKIFSVESVQFFGDKSSLVIVNKAE